MFSNRSGLEQRPYLLPLVSSASGTLIWLAFLFFPSYSSTCGSRTDSTSEKWRGRGAPRQEGRRWHPGSGTGSSSGHEQQVAGVGPLCVSLQTPPSAQPGPGGVWVCRGEGLRDAWCSLCTCQEKMLGVFSDLCFWDWVPRKKGCSVSCLTTHWGLLWCVSPPPLPHEKDNGRVIRPEECCFQWPKKKRERY